MASHLFNRCSADCIFRKISVISLYISSFYNKFTHFTPVFSQQLIAAAPVVDTRLTPFALIMGTTKHNIINDLEGAIMKPVSLIMGLACIALSLACLVLLVMNISGDCDRMTNLLCCLGFIPLSVLGADGCYKGLKDIIRKK